MKEQSKPIQCYFWGSIFVINHKICDEYKYDAFILQGNHFNNESSIIQITGNNAGAIHGSVRQDVSWTVASTLEAIIKSILTNFNSPDFDKIKITDHHITLSELFEIYKISNKDCIGNPFVQNTTDKLPDNKSKLYKTGTIFVIDYYYDGKYEREAHMLTESNDNETVFEITQITGYHAGVGGFYIKRQNGKSTISYDELIEGIKFNFPEPDIASLIILENVIKIKAFLQVLQPFIS